MSKKQTITNAIKNKIRAKISYRSEYPQGRGARVIEPIELGLGKDGTLLLKAWQVSGASYRAISNNAPVPGWRSFKVDQITGWRNSNKKFQDLHTGVPDEEEEIVKTIARAEEEPNTDTNTNTDNEREPEED